MARTCTLMVSWWTPWCSYEVSIDKHLWLVSFTSPRGVMGFNTPTDIRTGAMMCFRQTRVFFGKGEIREGIGGHFRFRIWMISRSIWTGQLQWIPGTTIRCL